MKRREVLRAGIAAPAVVGLRSTAGAAAGRPMNIILFVSDQERAVQHFPAGWAQRNLPGMTALQRNGLTFNRAFCCACMCSPSRASMFTGLFPAQHGVTDTLTFGTNYSDTEQVLARNIPNLATVLRDAGYDVVYKGKWHLSKPLSDPQTEEEARQAWRPRDVGIYGFDRWEPPDAGENQDLDQFGGGTANNDERFMTGRTGNGREQEGVLDYLRHVARPDHPFCLVVSLVNPHDVLSYPLTWQTGGYESEAWLKGEIGLPATWDEDLASKPIAQRSFLLTLAAGLGRLTTREQRLAYLNFYGNLLKRVDGYLVRMLALLHERSLIDNTLIIRTSDHGEMGLAHGGARQKMFNFYEESLRVPLVFSNPVLYPEAHECNALVSHVDLLPTLASFVGAPQQRLWQGIDYSRLLRKPDSHPTQHYVVFTFDDIRTGQNATQTALPPNRIVAIREGRYKLARYYDGAGQVPDQWEMYDLLTDPLERRNLAAPGYVPTPGQAAERERLTRKLTDEIQRHRLRPLVRKLKPEPKASAA